MSGASRTRSLCFAAVTVLLVATCAASGTTEDDAMAFWRTPRQGANFFNQTPTAARFEAAAAIGIDFARVAPDKWKTEARDFLIGDADQYAGLVPDDLRALQAALDDAHKAGIPVVLTMLSLPGCRWRQHNDGADDDRLWRDEAHLEQAAAFWRDLARELRDHPAIVAYTPLNEPHPAKTFGLDDPTSREFGAWVESARGSVADLDRFNRTIVQAIRAVDPDTPVMLEGWAHAHPAGLALLDPLDDARTLYAFHLYEPWLYTTRRVNRGRFVYPHRMPVEWGSDKTQAWPATRLASIVAPVKRWSAEHGIEPGRIVAAEFGVDRLVGGAAAYLDDAISAFEANGWHWAFYAFREDAWPNMDYELGSATLPDPLPPPENPRDPYAAFRRDNALFDVIKRRLGGEEAP